MERSLVVPLGPTLLPRPYVGRENRRQDRKRGTRFAGYVCVCVGLCVCVCERERESMYVCVCVCVCLCMCMLVCMRACVRGLCHVYVFDVHLSRVCKTTNQNYLVQLAGPFLDLILRVW